MITSINHITISVRNLERSFEFYTKILGLTPVARWIDGAYLLAGKVWIALILDENTRIVKLPEYSHLAFTVDENNFDKLVQTIEQYGVEKWQENRSEGRSYYFLDPDGYKLEIHTTDLDARLKSMKEDKWKDIEFFRL